MYVPLQSEQKKKHEPISVSNQSEDNTNLQPVAELNSALSSVHTPVYPCWPTSQPGPLAKEPAKGERPINPQRREQMVITTRYNEEYNANG